MNKKLLLSLVVVTVALVGCTLLDVYEGVEIAATLAPLIQGTPTPFYSGPIEVSLTNLQQVDICAVTSYSSLLGREFPGKTTSWNPGDFPSGITAPIHGLTKGTYDIDVFDCYGNIIDSGDGIALYADTVLESSGSTP